MLEHPALGESTGSALEADASTRTRRRCPDHSSRASSAPSFFPGRQLCRPDADREILMPDQDQAELRLSVARLRQEHEDYDVAINAMIQTGCDALRIQRMKKKKLVIKDKITKIEDQIIPDIIA
jgi:hypothetical protein